MLPDTLALATIRIGREILCIPYAGFFISFILHISLGSSAQKMLKRGSMFCWTIKLKESMNKQTISAFVPEDALLI